ncbi:RAD9, HUS1, RAD1-interacting nuclear orphan protein 1 [Ctenodactylus gundi]
MPPKKRRCQRSRKDQLVFHQPPLEGPKHHYGSAPRPLTHTRQVPSKPIDHSIGSSWVSPQFDAIVEPPAHRKHRHGDQAQVASRKSTCRFPPLIFESPQSSSHSETPGIPLVVQRLNQSEKDSYRKPLVPVLSPQSGGDLSVQALQSFPYVLTPPDIQTPGASPVREGPAAPEHKDNSLPSFVFHTGAPSSPEPGPVLVKDTPEEKYGLKVTWRRRRHLFVYLRERGRLSRSQFLVQS